MKKDYIDISIVLDRSGSMSSIKDDTIGGFNTFLSEQQKQVKNGTFTLVQFDDQYEVVYNGINIKDAQSLTDETFQPRGSTALLDAIGKTINSIGARLDKLKEDQKPEKVIVTIITDGYENASHEFNNTKINEMINHQRQKYNWEFVFIGSNQDAIATASNMGISASNSITYANNPLGVTSVFRSLSTNMVGYCSGNAIDMSFNAADRATQDALLNSY